MTKANRLPETLKRNGLNYKMIARTERVGLWELLVRNKRVGFEVSQIYVHPEQIKFGKIVSPKESLPSNSKFGVKDNSKSFFPNEFETANEYFKKLTTELELRDLLIAPIKKYRVASESVN